MNTRYSFGPEAICGPISSSSATYDRSTVVPRARVRGASEGPATLMVRLAMKISRARWFSFLRRVFHYQNGSRSDLGSNPFNSSGWMALELLALVVQICITTTTLMISKEEKPVWPMRIWITGYDIGCVFNILMLYGRYRQLNNLGQRDTLLDIEQHGGAEEEESRAMHDVMNKSRTSLELLFAIWFVMGNVWVLDSRLGSMKRAPKLHYLCVSLLAWNAITYSFPFLLFLLLCCFVPLISTLLGYNMNMGSLHKGASDYQISNLPTWNFKELEPNTNLDDDDPNYQDSECCCICLAKYRDKEQVRQLPCSHLFHLNCVDQWLKIISCCPLCKQQLQR